MSCKCKLNEDLFYFASKGKFQRMKQAILDGADINAQDNECEMNTALIYVIEYSSRNLDVVNWLVAHGANQEISDEFGNTPLIVSARWNCVDIAKFLLENGANVDAKDKWGYTALMRASIKGHFDVAKLLLEYGADTSIVDNEFKTALTLAKAQGESEIVDLLESDYQKSFLDQKALNSYVKRERLVDSQIGLNF